MGMKRIAALVLLVTTTAAAEPIPAGTTQLITGITAGWDATAVTLQRWTRRDGAWVADGASWRGVVGHTGLAWGRGLHGDGAPTAHAGPVKHEGDGKSPAGVFALRGAYGTADRPPPHTQLTYTPTSADWQCVDDPVSTHYTQIVDRRQLTVDWQSAEAMHRRDALYTWVIDIAHNPRAEPGAGSCIFFHVWRNARTGTVGCTAMPAPAIRQLISHLAPSAIYVLLPRAEYQALAAAWDLPAAN